MYYALGVPCSFPKSNPNTKGILIVASAVMFVCVLFSVPSAFGQSEGQGKLRIAVNPQQAYVFVDGKAIRDGSQTIELPAGTHEVGVYNYGYIPDTQEVHIAAGRSSDLNVSLVKSGDAVSGPFGDIEFRGHPRAAVLLNGTTPAYFVGHVDEFDWDWIWHQRLLVQPGTYNVTVTRKGTTVWSGPVTVKAGQRVTVNLDHNGQITTRNWPAGNTLGPQPRFHAGVASAVVPIAPVTAQFSANPEQTGCGQPAKLDWKTADAADTSITNLGEVPVAGDRSVDPSRTTTYQLAAKGPGGEVTKTVTVDVSTQPVATLTLSQPEVHYHKIGDKVVQDDSSILKWSASNASKVTITPLGSEALSGSHTIEAKPLQSGIGAVNDTVPYTLVASNTCGGKVSQTALLHVVGSIDPAPPVKLASVFYPTKYPRPMRPKVGLVAAEQETLSNAANTFKSHEQYDGHASLLVVGHADVRGSAKYNMKLSERRANLVKTYLVSQGVPADKIQIRADGKAQELSEKQVAQLQAEDTQKPDKWMQHHSRATWLAYNRRVDILLEPTGQQSAEEYPNDATHARILWERAEPRLKTVEAASKMPAETKIARASGLGD
jgi:OmpA family protein/PEGA domain-containing protein